MSLLTHRGSTTAKISDGHGHHVVATESHNNAESTLNPRKVQEAQFAGRIGANQGFIASSDNDDLLKRQPDAVG